MARKRSNKKLFPDSTSGPGWPVPDPRPQDPRDATQEALQKKGFLRKPSQVQNDNEKFNQAKPKDIGEPGRDPFQP